MRKERKRRMKKFQVEVSYLNKAKELKTVENVDNVTALTYVLNSLSLTEKDNVIGVKLTYLGE